MPEGRFAVCCPLQPEEDAKNVAKDVCSQKCPHPNNKNKKTPLPRLDKLRSPALVPWTVTGWGGLESWNKGLAGPLWFLVTLRETEGAFSLGDRELRSLSALKRKAALKLPYPGQGSARPGGTSGMRRLRDTASEQTDGQMDSDTETQNSQPPKLLSHRVLAATPGCPTMGAKAPDWREGQDNRSMAKESSRKCHACPPSHSCTPLPPFFLRSGPQMPGIPGQAPANPLLCGWGHGPKLLGSHFSFSAPSLSLFKDFLSQELHSLLPSLPPSLPPHG